MGAGALATSALAYGVTDRADATPSLCQTSSSGGPYGFTPTRSWVNAYYGATADWETYSQASDCWYNNDYEDGTGAEGVDCSGLVAKVWGLYDNYGSNAGWYVWTTNYDHRPGGINTWSLETGENASWKTINYGDRTLMDIAVRDISNPPPNGSHHTFLVVSPSADGRSDYTLEAQNRQSGKDVGYFTRVNAYQNTWGWRSRKGWG